MLLWPTLGQLTTFFQKSEIDENWKKFKKNYKPPKIISYFANDV